MIEFLSIYNISHWFLIFICYSFLGWCAEMVYCTIADRKLCRDRGFLNGPLCPIYGCGALMILMAMQYIPTSPGESAIKIFFIGAILATVLEYIVSYIMEKLFHMRWWDYSSKKYQINGRVCLLNSLLFGVGAVVIVRLIMPWLHSHSGNLSREGTIALGFCLLGIFLSDLVMSVRSAVLIGSRLEKLQKLESELTAKAEEQVAAMAETVSDITEELRSRYEVMEFLKQQRTRELQERIHAARGGQDFFERRMMRAFPRLKSRDYGEVLKSLREEFAERVNSK